jgi:chaperonin GroES
VVVILFTEFKEEGNMTRKDLLAAGKKSAVFQSAAVPGAEEDIFRNVSDEARIDPVVEVSKPVEVRKRFIPNPGILLVRPIEVKSPVSTIILEEDPAKKERPSEGIVLERGTGDLGAITIGTQIVYGKYSGTEFKLNGETLLLMKFEDVLGSIEEESNA